jgi:GT2 family glycosyltransferase
MTDMTLAIVIATRNRQEDLRITLTHVIPLLSDAVSCTVYDDGSTDQTSAMVRTEFPQVSLLRNEVSRGYLYCRNRLLNETTADIAVSLDDDAHFLSEAPIPEIIRFFNETPTCGVAAFRIFWSDSPTSDTQTCDTPQVVKSFVGCGHAWRMTAWRDTPQYPEWFEFYGEENVASMDLFRKGWQVWYVPQVLVWHRVNLARRSVIAKDKSIRARRSLRAGWYSYGLFFPPLKVMRRLASSGWHQLRKVFRGDRTSLYAVSWSVWDLIVHLPVIFRERRAMSKAGYAKYQQLPEAKIFWKPESKDPRH